MTAVVRLTFFMGFDLRMGRGGENVLFNLLLHKPDDISITVVETDLLDSIRKQESFVDDVRKRCRLLRIHTTNYWTNNVLAQLYRDLIVRPIIRDMRILRNTGILEEIRDTDVVYLFYNHYSAFFSGMGIPVIASPHSGEVLIINKHKESIYGLIYKIYRRIYFKNVNGYHAFPKNSKDLEKLSMKYKMVLSNGVDTKLFYPDTVLNNGKVKFLFVGAMRSEKGLDILLPLIDRVNVEEMDVEFHMAGTGPLVDDIKGNRKIIYHGVPGDEELAKLYRECDVFIYPSHSDSFGLVVLEALSSGMYVLAGEYLRGNFDEFEGKYLEYIPMDVDSFYNRVMEIVRDRSIIEHDKREEYEFVRKNYDWSIIAEKFYGYMRKFYEESRTSRSQRLQESS